MLRIIYTETIRRPSKAHNGQHNFLHQGYRVLVFPIWPLELGSRDEPTDIEQIARLRNRFVYDPGVLLRALAGNAT